MSLSLQNQWVVITGASSGFGAAAALEFARAGACLLLGARRIDRLRGVAEAARNAGAPRALARKLDVTRTRSVDAFAAWVRTLTPRVYVLVNNAGGAKGLDPVASGKDADWEFMVEANVLGVLRTIRAMLPLMPGEPGSTILNIGSVAGRTPYENGAAYCAAKAGELALTRALRLELCGSGIRICTLDPGLAETEFALVRFGGDARRAKAVYDGMIPLAAGDVAEAMVWMATRPPHVCIDEVVIKPTDQAAVHKVHRRAKA